MVVDLSAKNVRGDLTIFDSSKIYFLSKYA